MLELENTYLLKELPEDFLNDCNGGTDNVIKGSKEIIDIYMPKDSDHPKIRLRKNGEKYELTKKEPVVEGDASIQNEQTIILTEEEFQVFSKMEGKRVEKIRYLYEYAGRIAEVDVFKGDLEGLAVVDFEFTTEESKNKFDKPEFCLVDITQDTFIAGGIIAGKKYSDLEEILKNYNYTKLLLTK